MWFWLNLALENLPLLLLTLYFELDPLLNPELALLARLGGQQAPGMAVFAPLTLVCHAAWLLHPCCGFELRFPCLPSKLFTTEWSPQPFISSLILTLWIEGVSKEKPFKHAQPPHMVKVRTLTTALLSWERWHSHSCSCFRISSWSMSLRLHGPIWPGTPTVPV